MIAYFSYEGHTRGIAEKTQRIMEGELFEIRPSKTTPQITVRRNAKPVRKYHIADVVHSEIILFEHPEWVYNSDTDYKEGMQSAAV